MTDDPLTEALDELDKARGLACKVTHDGRWDAAKAALISIYNRQREEIAEKHRHFMEIREELMDAERELERLKAEQPKFTQEDATRLRDWAMCWSHRPFYDLADRIESALRLRSLSEETK